MQEMRIWSLVWEDPSSETWVPTFQSLSSESVSQSTQVLRPESSPLRSPLKLEGSNLPLCFPRPCFLQHSSLGYLHLLHLLFSSPIAVELFPVLYYLCWNMILFWSFPGPCLEKNWTTFKKVVENLFKSNYLKICLPSLEKGQTRKQPQGSLVQIICHIPMERKPWAPPLAVGWIPWSTHLSALSVLWEYFPVHFPRDYWGFYLLLVSVWGQGDLIRNEQS